MKSRFKKISNQLVILGMLPIGVFSLFIFIYLFLKPSSEINNNELKPNNRIDTVLIECNRRHFECSEEVVPNQVKPKKVEKPKVEEPKVEVVKEEETTNREND